MVDLDEKKLEWFFHSASVAKTILVPFTGSIPITKKLNRQVAIHTLIFSSGWNLDAT
jgi:hypothetical protein